MTDLGWHMGLTKSEACHWHMGDGDKLLLVLTRLTAPDPSR